MHRRNVNQVADNLSKLSLPMLIVTGILYLQRFGVIILRRFQMISSEYASQQPRTLACASSSDDKVSQLGCSLQTNCRWSHGYSSTGFWPMSLLLFFFCFLFVSVVCVFVVDVCIACLFRVLWFFYCLFVCFLSFYHFSLNELPFIAHGKKKKHKQSQRCHYW